MFVSIFVNLYCWGPRQFSRLNSTKKLQSRPNVAFLTSSCAHRPQGLLHLDSLYEMAQYPHRTSSTQYSALITQTVASNHSHTMKILSLLYQRGSQSGTLSPLPVAVHTHYTILSHKIIMRYYLCNKVWCFFHLISSKMKL